MTIFETARTAVRHLDHGDFDAMMTVYGDPIAMRWVDDSKPLSAGDCRKWIDRTLLNYSQKGYGLSVIEDRRSGGLLGYCGLVHPGHQPEAEIKYTLLRQHWGQGIATEVVKGMLNYGAKEHGLELVIATVYPPNLASIRVLQKAGMVRPTPQWRPASGSLEEGVDYFLWQPG